ncbi:MAG: hypothetical protein ACOYLQ_00095 [Hyphomicrobiaceae bacterium]
MTPTDRGGAHTPGDPAVWRCGMGYGAPPKKFLSSIDFVLTSKNRRLDFFGRWRLGNTRILA